MLGRSKLSGKKTRQRRGSDCRGGRDAVGGAAKCRGCRSIWRQGRVWQGKKGKFRKIGWNGHQVRAILSRFGDLEPPSLSGKSSSCPYIRPWPLIGCFFEHARDFIVRENVSQSFFFYRWFFNWLFCTRESLAFRCSAIIAPVSANFGS